MEQGNHFGEENRVFSENISVMDLNERFLACESLYLLMRRRCNGYKETYFSAEELQGARTQWWGSMSLVRTILRFHTISGGTLGGMTLEALHEGFDYSHEKEGGMFCVFQVFGKSC